MQKPMKSKLDAKSLLTGFLVGAAVSLCIAASTKDAEPVGRFQTVINDNGSVVMTDTKTGEAWNTDFVTPPTIRDSQFKKPKLE